MFLTAGNLVVESTPLLQPHASPVDAFLSETIYGFKLSIWVATKHQAFVFWDISRMEGRMRVSMDMWLKV